MNANSRLNVIVLVVYLVTALLYLMPLPLHFATAISGDNGDSYPNLWPFWYYPYAAITGNGGFFFHKLLFYPEGVHLVYTSSSTIGACLMAPISLLFSPAAALNAWLVLHLWLGGFFLFKFVRVFSAGVSAAWVAGLTYQWMPFNAAHLPGHYTLSQIAFTTIALYCLAVLARRASAPADNTAPRWTSLVAPATGLSLACWAVAVSDFYLAIMTVYLLITVLIYMAVDGRFRAGLRSVHFWGALASGAILTFALLIPWVLAIQNAREGHDYSPLDPLLVSRNVAEWRRLISIPGWHPVWQPLAFPDMKGVVGVFNEWPYLGMVGFFVAALGLLFMRPVRSSLVWIIAFVLAVGLAADNRHSYVHGGDDHLFTFGRYWPDFFPFSEFRVAGRWQFVLCVIVSIVLAFAIDALLALPKNAASPRRRSVTVAGLTALLVFDLMRWPFPLCPAEPLDEGIPSAASGAVGPVLDIPVGMTSGMGHYIGHFVPETLRRQMHHGRPLLSVNVSRLPNDVINSLKNDPELTAFFAVQSSVTAELDIDLAEQDAAPPPPRNPVDDVLTSSGLHWPGFRERFGFTSVRIPADWPTSGPLREIIDRTAPGQWQWHEAQGNILGNLK